MRQDRAGPSVADRARYAFAGAGRGHWRRTRGGRARGRALALLGVNPAAVGDYLAGGLTPRSYRRFTHTLRGSRLLQLPNRNTGRDNGNPLNMSEGKHIRFIPGNNHIDLTDNPGSQDRIVLRVRRHLYIWQNGYEHRVRLQIFKKLFNISKRDVWPKLATVKNRPQLPNLVIRSNKRETPIPDSFQKAAWRPFL